MHFVPLKMVTLRRIAVQDCIESHDGTLYTVTAPRDDRNSDSHSAFSIHLLTPFKSLTNN